MQFATRFITPIMLIAGILTLTMLYAAIAPQAALDGMFGESLSGPLAGIIVRNWAALIAIGGATLIWGAFHPPVRPVILMAVGASKLVFIGLLLSLGSQYLPGQAGVAVALDSIAVVLFALYLLENRKKLR